MAVKILGAGIAGLTAAINLAKNGYNVTVYEKQPFVGQRFCNDFQGLENWSEEKDSTRFLEEISIKPTFWHAGFNKVDIYTDLNKKFVARDKKNFFYLVKRGPKNSLDENLKNQALEAGAKILFNSKVCLNECDIIATGPFGKKQVCIAKGIVFDTNAKDSITLILNKKLASNGYSYLLIAGKKATFASVLFGDFQKANECFKNSLAAIKKLKKVSMANEKPFAGFGAFAIPNNNVSNQKLVIGEAAGFQDFFLGFGMKYAFLSGYLAAKSLVEKKNYNVLWKESILNKLKASVSNRFLYELFGNWGHNYLVRRAISSPSPNEWLKEFYGFSLGKIIVYPFARLKYWQFLPAEPKEKKVSFLALEKVL